MRRARVRPRHEFSETVSKSSSRGVRPVALADFIAALDELSAAALAAFQAATSSEQLEAARVEFLGAKSGRLKDAQKGLGQIDKADKPAAGQKFNEVKGALEAALAE